VKLNKENYGAGLKEVDFAADAEGARKTINAWVEKETKEKIKELLRPGVVGSDTRLVLTNAIYFKGDWARQFKKDATREEEFRLGGGKGVRAPLMRQRRTFGYLDGGTFQALEMPYAGKDLSMVVLLPKKLDGLPDLEKSLTPDDLVGWLKRLREQEVDVALPRFKLTAEFELKPVLSSLGMPLAFTAGKADFSGVDGSRKLFLSAVVHKAFVDVNEQGTEAAAATGVVARATAVHVTPVFRADHPFVFLIRDRRSDSVLFLGRLANPR
jgi:serpin B